MERVIVLGHDHTNTLGVIQAMGLDGYYVIACVWGKKTGLVASSRFTKEIITGSSPNECVDLLITRFSTNEKPIVVIPCCDDAAFALESNKEVNNTPLKSQYACGDYSIAQISDKSLQVKLAKDCGFNVPYTQIIEDNRQIPEEVPFPCLIKPMISSKGSKAEIQVCYSREELIDKMSLIRSSSPLLLQQYIEKQSDKLVYGCALTNGKCIIPSIITKTKLYPKKTGLGMINNIETLCDDEKRRQIESLVSKIGYVGLFSIEYSTSDTDSKDYFIEINLRNDGTNAVYYKAGVNLPAIHSRDLCGESLPVCISVRNLSVIFEMNYVKSVIDYRG